MSTAKLRAQKSHNIVVISDFNCTLGSARFCQELRVTCPNFVTYSSIKQERKHEYYRFSYMYSQPEYLAVISETQKIFSSKILFYVHVDLCAWKTAENERNRTKSAKYQILRCVEEVGVEMHEPQECGIVTVANEQLSVASTVSSADASAAPGGRQTLTNV